MACLHRDAPRLTFPAENRAAHPLESSSGNGANSVLQGSGLHENRIGEPPTLLAAPLDAYDRAVAAISGDDLWPCVCHGSYWCSRPDRGLCLAFCSCLEPRRHVHLRVLHRPRWSGRAFVLRPGSLATRGRVTLNIGSSSSSCRPPPGNCVPAGYMCTLLLPTLRASQIPRSKSML